MTKDYETGPLSLAFASQMEFCFFRGNQMVKSNDQILHTVLYVFLTLKLLSFLKYALCVPKYFSFN